MKTFIFLYFTCVLTAASLLNQETTLEESMQRGSEIYADFCVTCHLEKGEGVEGAFPPLAKSDYLAQNREASIRGIKYGQQGELVVNGQSYNGIMAPMGLEDEEIADVMNYILNSWGNQSDKMVSVEEVGNIQKQ